MADNISVRRKNWFVSLHMICIGLWIGTAASMTVLAILAATTNNRHLLIGTHYAMNTFDNVLMIPVALAARLMLFHLNQTPCMIPRVTSAPLSYQCITMQACD